MSKREEAFDAVDAVVFSSDMFFSAAEYQSFKEYLGRWCRAVAAHESDALSAPPTVQPSDPGVSDHTLAVLHNVRLSLGMANPGAEWTAANFEALLLGTLRAMERHLASPQAEAPVPPAGATQKPGPEWGGL